MTELLRIRDLSTGDTNKAVLSQFRLQVFSSEILGIVGLNGSGKSTLADVLSGEARVQTGQIYLNGIRFDLHEQKISRLLLEKQGIFVVKNENKLIGNFNVSENMSISLKHRMSDLFRNPGKKEKLVDLTLTEFFPELNPDTDVNKLSLAVQWEIGVLKAYISGAQLIVLDRIIEFCSDNERQELLRFIKILRKKGTSFIITYNKISPVLKHFDRLGVVRNGKLSGIIHQIDYDPKLLANLIIGREYVDRVSIKNDSLSVGSKLLEVQNLTSGTAMGDVGLTLHSGEILGLYDPIQDKSAELINILNGDSPLGKQKVLVGDQEVSFSEKYHAIRAGIGIVSEKIFDQLFFKDLTAGQNLVISAAKRSAVFCGHIPLSAEKFLETQYLAGTGIPDTAARLPVKLIEKDLQFILALHMRILSGVKIFLLENPMGGADLLTRKIFYQRIESLRKTGTGVIFISTDYTDLDGFCDRVIQYDKIGSI